jgi:hypothetical protein
MDRLVSKIAAGGLSAGIFLIWWPEHVQGEELVHLILRGLLWTLTFELLLVSFGPLEDLASARVRRRMEARRDRVRNRLAAVPAPARTGGAVALACMGLAAPLTLLAGAPTHLVKDDSAPRVVKQVIVQRPVVERKVVVRRVVAPAAAAPVTASGTPAPSVRATEAVRRTAATQPRSTAEAPTTAAATTRRQTTTAARATTAPATTDEKAPATTAPANTPPASDATATPQPAAAPAPGTAPTATQP